MNADIIRDQAEKAIDFCLICKRRTFNDWANIKGFSITEKKAIRKLYDDKIIREEVKKRNEFWSNFLKKGGISL